MDTQTFHLSDTSLLSAEQIREVIARADAPSRKMPIPTGVRDGASPIDAAPLTGRRVLVILPDGTRSGPVGFFFHLFCELLLARVAALDFLIALGTHPPLTDAQIQEHLKLTDEERAQLEGRVKIFNHEWWNPATFYTAGVIPSWEIRELSIGLMNQDVPVRLNRAIRNYDLLILCGPVFPHEVVGFSGGHKYLFPGIAGAEIIHFTHWLGALLTSYAIIGTQDTPVRAIIERAAQCVTIPRLAVCYVVRENSISGLYVGAPYEAWRLAAGHSAREHIIYLDHPVARVLSLIPPRYQDLWTAAKGMYKVEPVIADGGEVILYAPSLTEVSYTHGPQIEAIGYHVRDYFVKQWDRFKHYPWGILAHSTHLRGIGEYDAVTGWEAPRIRVTLATAISPERCAHLNLDYADPRAIQPAAWKGTDMLVVPNAGERLYKYRRTADASLAPVSHDPADSSHFQR